MNYATIKNYPYRHVGNLALIPRQSGDSPGKIKSLELPSGSSFSMQALGSPARRKRLEKLLIFPDATVRQAIEAIDRGALGIALIIDAQGKLLSTITDGDVRRASLDHLNHDAPVNALLVYRPQEYRTPTVVKPHTSPEQILRLFRAKSIRQLPVVDDEGFLIDLIELSELMEDKPSLSAVIMAGGFGTRLRPFTESTPKPMLPVGNRPLMERMLENLQETGIRNVTISTHYKREVIINHFHDGAEFGININYVNEEQPLGTAGALGLMQTPDDTVLIINGDILTNVNFESMFQFHREHHAEMTVATRIYEFQLPYGVVEMEGVNITKITEKPKKKFFVSAGIYLLEPVTFSYIPKNQRFDMTDLIETMLKEERRVVNFPIREYWLDIGRHPDYERAQVEAAQL